LGEHCKMMECLFEIGARLVFLERAPYILEQSAILWE
jgi:hypothetical protein